MYEKMDWSLVRISMGFLITICSLFAVLLLYWCCLDDMAFAGLI